MEARGVDTFYVVVMAHAGRSLRWSRGGLAHPVQTPQKYNHAQVTVSKVGRQRLVFSS